MGKKSLKDRVTRTVEKVAQDTVGVVSDAVQGVGAAVDVVGGMFGSDTRNKTVEVDEAHKSFTKGNIKQVATILQGKTFSTPEEINDAIDRTVHGYNAEKTNDMVNAVAKQAIFAQGPLEQKRRQEYYKNLSASQLGSANSGGAKSVNQASGSSILSPKKSNNLLGI